MGRIPVIWANGLDFGQNGTQMTGISSEINLFEHKIPVMLTLTGIEALKRNSSYLEKQKGWHERYFHATLFYLNQLSGDP